MQFLDWRLGAKHPRNTQMTNEKVAKKIYYISIFKDILWKSSIHGYRGAVTAASTAGPVWTEGTTWQWAMCQRSTADTGSAVEKKSSAWLRSASWPPFCLFWGGSYQSYHLNGVGFEIWRSPERNLLSNSSTYRFQVDSTNSPRINLVTPETFRSSSLGVSSIWCARILLLRSRRFELRTEPSRTQWNLNATLRLFLPQTSPTTNPFKIPFQPFICFICFILFPSLPIKSHQASNHNIFQAFPRHGSHFHSSPLSLRAAAK